MPKILAIDDKKDNLTTLSGFLKSFIPRCNFITAQSGIKGIEKAKTEMPDLIILDIKMPGMDGYETCKNLKKNEITRHIPVIMISALKTESKDLINGLDAGADAYLTKPLDEHVFTAQVKAALRIKKAEDMLRDQKDLLESKVQERTDDLMQSNLLLKHEINDRRQTEEALRKSEEKINAILQASPVGLALVINRKIDWVNETLCRMLGYEKDYLVGQSTRILYHDDNEYERACRELSAANNEAKIGNVETQAVRRDGTAFDCRINGWPLDIKDPSKGMIVSVNDISEAKRLEAQLRQSQKMESIGTLAGGVAHDFNNLLTVIIGNAELGLFNLDKDNPSHKFLEAIMKAGKSANSLTSQLLAFSRKQVIHAGVLDINEVLKKLEKMLRRLIKEDIELKIIPCPGLSPVKADPGQMEQVVMNLVVNARYAMPHGGDLTIETADVDLDTKYFLDHNMEDRSGHYVMLSVSDTGIGMDEEIKSHIFEPFFTTKEKGSGTGLGLSTVYGIIKQSGGYIWAYSEPGKGTTLKLYLPAVEKDDKPKKKETTPAKDLRGSETVLIVEDDDNVRATAIKFLQRQGYKILAATNGEDALRVSREHEGPIALTITDVVMPNMSGREVVKQLQQLYPEMKVIYMSGYTDGVLVDQGVLEPGLNFLEKPFTPDGMALKVRGVLDKKQD